MGACFIRNARPNDGKGLFWHVLKIASTILRQVSKDKTAEAYSSIERISAQ